MIMAVQYNTDKFSEVIKVVAENGYLGPKEIVKCGQYIGEEHQILAWKRATENYRKYIEEDASREKGRRVKFDKPIDLCSSTRAKKEFKLSDEDIHSLPWQEVYVRAARAYFPFYKTSDVIATMYSKYGKHRSKDIRELKGKREIRRTTVRNERIAYIDSIIDEQYKKHLKNLPESHVHLFDDLKTNLTTRSLLVREYETNGKNKRRTKWSIEKAFENLVVDHETHVRTHHSLF